MRIALVWCATAVLLGLLLSCGSRDDRDEVRSRNGEPDEIQTMGIDFRWRELWFYNDSGIVFEFRQNAGCGSTKEVYLSATYSFIPDTSGGAAAVRQPQPDQSPEPLPRSPSNNRVMAP